MSSILCSLAMLRLPLEASQHEHSACVARVAVLIGERLGYDDGALGALRLAAILHDVGKSEVPEEILRKPEPLTAAERELVERHLLYAALSEDGAGAVDDVVGLV